MFWDGKELCSFTPKLTFRAQMSDPFLYIYVCLSCQKVYVHATSQEFDSVEFVSSSFAALPVEKAHALLLKKEYKINRDLVTSNSVTSLAACKPCVLHNFHVKRINLNL